LNLQIWLSLPKLNDTTPVDGFRSIRETLPDPRGTDEAYLGLKQSFTGPLALHVAPRNAGELRRMLNVLW
jgi:hypothetical protein